MFIRNNTVTEKSTDHAFLQLFVCFFFFSHTGGSVIAHMNKTQRKQAVNGVNIIIWKQSLCFSINRASSAQLMILHNSHHPRKKVCFQRSPEVILIAGALSLQSTPSMTFIKVKTAVAKHIAHALLEVLTCKIFKVWIYLASQPNV